ncbi:uncharacterized protein LOC113122661 [Mastacembelus armatus]|uniref:uncharacterized protein LOC113122661 n=1 Tax=Mastacembelus armatus TaxID=205130 RepID=UPI000E458320|nr:uncharacterized protein LOC113122661 [Mastacembelus armatus]
MLNVWLTLFLLLSGGRAFMIHNIHWGLCLEEDTGEALLKECKVDSESQQWVWANQDMLMCVASSRCLSAHQKESFWTQSCRGTDVDSAGLMWYCDRGRLISRNTSLILSADGQRLILAYDSKYSKWKSLDEGDICQEKLRLKRASDDPDEFEVGEQQSGELAAMTEEQRAYLRWYYRTEDSTTWTFVLLGLAFVCLLVGFLLLGMGAMANKNRKKIAKYKAAASLVQNSEGEVLQIISPLTVNSSSKPPPSSSSTHRLLQGNQSPMYNREVSEVLAGNIVVTWKDGNTSCLYPDLSLQEEERKEEQEEHKEKPDEQEEKQKVTPYGATIEDRDVARRRGSRLSRGPTLEISSGN